MLIPTDARQSTTPLLFGRLRTDRGRLECVTFCTGGCRCSHAFAWEPAWTLGHLVEVPAPCTDLASPFRGGKVRVRLDPRHRAKNQGLLDALRPRR